MAGQAQGGQNNAGAGQTAGFNDIVDPGFNMDLGFGSGGSSGSGGDTFFQPGFDDPSNVVGDPFFDPVFGSQMMGGDTGQPGRAPYTQDPSEQRGGDQPRQQDQQPTAAGGGGRQQNQNPLSRLSTGLQQLSKFLGGNQQPRGPSFIQPQQQQQQAPGQPPQAPQTPTATDAISNFLSGKPQPPPQQTQPQQQQQPQQPQQPQAPQGTEGGGAPASSPPTAQAPPPAPEPQPAAFAPTEQPLGGLNIPNITQPLSPTLTNLAATSPSPPPAAAPEPGAGPGAAVAQAAPTAAPDTTNKTLLDQLSGKTVTPTMENRLLPQQQAGEPRADVDFLNQRGAHSTTTAQGVRGAWGAYMANPDLGRRLADAGRAFEKETGQRAQFGEGDRDRAIQGVYYDRFRRGVGGKAAAPGQSQHQFNRAMDIPDGPFANWLKRGNARRFGLHNPVRNDPNHFQPFGTYKGSAPMSEAPGKRSQAGGQQFAQAPQATATDATTGAQPLPGSRGVLNQPNTIWTSYEPGGGRTARERRMEGGRGTANPGLDGQRKPRTLEDYQAGRSKYVTVSGPESQQGMTVMIPTRNGPVPGYIHDTGGRFTEGSNKLDVATKMGQRGRSPSKMGPQSMDLDRRTPPPLPEYPFSPPIKTPPHAPMITPVPGSKGPGGPWLDPLPRGGPYGQRIGANTPVPGETPQPGNPFPSDVGTGAGQLPSGPLLDTIRRLHEERKRNQGISEDGSFQVAGDLKELHTGTQSLDAIRRLLMAPTGSTKGQQTIDRLGGKQSPTLDLLDVLPFKQRSELLQWLLSQDTA